MQYLYVYLVPLAMVVSAVVTSMILGLLLRYLGKFISEISIQVKLGILTILAIAVGFSIFSSFVVVSNAYLITYPLLFMVFIVPSALSLCIGLITLFCMTEE
jgi:sugar phosphate permease